MTQISNKSRTTANTNTKKKKEKQNKLNRVNKFKIKYLLFNRYKSLT